MSAAKQMILSKGRLFVNDYPAGIHTVKVPEDPLDVFDEDQDLLCQVKAKKNR